MIKYFSFFIIYIFLFTSCENEVNKNAKENLNPAKKNGFTSKDIISLDMSPMDVEYYPVDYPKLKMAKKNIGNPLVKVTYSRPQKNGRVVFGGLIPYNQPWRLGANENTQIQFYKSTIFNNIKIDAGIYSIYCIPSETKWKIVLNTNTDTWGLDIDSLKDVISTEVDVTLLKEPIEHFTIFFDKTKKMPLLHFTWDYVDCSLPINFE